MDSRDTTKETKTLDEDYYLYHTTDQAKTRANKQTCNVLSTSSVYGPFFPTLVRILYINITIFYQSGKSSLDLFYIRVRVKARATARV